MCGHSASAAGMHSVLFPLSEDLSVYLVASFVVSFFFQLMQVVHRQSEQIAEVSQKYVNRQEARFQWLDFLAKCL